MSIEERMKNFWENKPKPKLANTDKKFQVKPIEGKSKHNWGKWSSIRPDDVQLPNLPEEYIYIIQEKSCKECNFKELNVHRYLIK